MPRLNNTELLTVIAKHLERMSRPETVVIGEVKEFRHVGTTIGNRDPRGRIFTLRPDVESHFHAPGTYFCGKCMLVVAV